jgi:soluble lytic murein transglycosylase-like protein
MKYLLIVTLVFSACSAPVEQAEWAVSPANVRTPTPPDPWLAPDESAMARAVEAHFSDPVHSLGWTTEYIPPPTPAPVLWLAAPSGATRVSAASFGSGTEQWRSLVAAYFPAESVDAVLSIMQCESGGNPLATNGVHQGLMQTNVGYHQPKADLLFGPGRSLYEPEVNIAVSAMISGGYSWAAWSCKP